LLTTHKPLCFLAMVQRSEICPHAVAPMLGTTCGARGVFRALRARAAEQAGPTVRLWLVILCSALFFVCPLCFSVSSFFFFVFFPKFGHAFHIGLLCGISEAGRPLATLLKAGVAFGLRSFAAIMISAAGRTSKPRPASVFARPRKGNLWPRWSAALAELAVLSCSSNSPNRARKLDHMSTGRLHGPRVLLEARRPTRPCALPAIGPLSLRQSQPLVAESTPI